MIRFLLRSSCFSILILFVQTAFTLPRFALLTGSQCQAYHVDPTGGRMRNFTGFNYGKDELPIRATRSDFDVSPKLSNNVSIGADFRTQYLYDGFSETTSFQAMTAALYGSLAVGKKISIYYKQDIISGYLSGTEAFGLLKVFPKNSYIKVGLFYPSYGLRLDDHTSYTGLPWVLTLS